MSELKRVKEWFELALKEKTEEKKQVQVGCIVEEFAELFEAINLNSEGLKYLSDRLKEGCFKLEFKTNKIVILDALADIIVTVVGLAHLLDFDIIGALREVNKSNFSKFEDGNIIFDKIGKIGKGKNYQPPNLEKFI